LAVIFEGAIKPTPEEMERARQRKEIGNPPGYPSQPLGDQIAWEQLLTYCRIAGVKRLWIASNDSDYVTKFDKRVLLNPFLHLELMQTCGDKVEVWCFDNAMGAVKDFGKNAGVKAEKLPTQEKSQEIEKELRSLDRDLHFFISYADDDHRVIAEGFLDELYRSLLKRLGSSKPDTGLR